MRNLVIFVQSNKYWLLSLLLLIAAVVFIVINQIDYLSRFSVAIVALSLLGLSIVFAGWGCTGASTGAALVVTGSAVGPALTTSGVVPAVELEPT